MTEHTTNNHRTSNQSNSDRRALIGLTVALGGCILGMYGYWMYLEAGGTLLRDPSSNLYMIPTVVGVITCILGHAAAFGGQNVDQSSPVQETQQAYVSGELTELELEQELEQHEDDLLDYE